MKFRSSRLHTYIASRSDVLGLVSKGRFRFSELLNFDVLLLGNRCIFEHETNQKRYPVTFEKAVLSRTPFVWQRHEVQTNTRIATHFLLCQLLVQPVQRPPKASEMPRAEGILDL